MFKSSVPRYQIPTHLDTPDTIDLPLFGITVSVTMRQGIVYLVGWSTAFHLWQQSLGFAGVVHWAVPVLLAFLTYVLAVHTVHGRHLEHWALVLSRSRALPNVFVWRRVLLDDARLRNEEPEASDELQKDEEAV